MKSSRLFLAVVVCALSSVGLSFADASKFVRFREAVKDEYIVVMAESAPPLRPAATALVQLYGGSVVTEYPSVKAFAARMTGAQALALSDHPFVKRIEENAIFRVAATSPQTGLLAVTNGQNAIWGIDRIDQTSPTSPRVDGQYAWCAMGTGVYIYVMDTGVKPDHLEFGGRVDTAPDFDTYLANNGQAVGQMECWDDSAVRTRANCGHGTGVASIAAGDTYGVAKNAIIVDLRTADGLFGATPLSRMLAALEFLNTSDTRTGQKVLNISASSLTTFDSRETTLKQMIGTLTDAAQNFKVVVAAGNEDSDAWWYIPSSAERAISVGGINKDADTKWASSNWGGEVDFYAPAQFLESASQVLPPWSGLSRPLMRSELSDCSTGGLPDTCTSGTSFAAPHVAGVVARYLERHPHTRRDDVVNALNSISATYSGATITDRTGVTRRIVVFSECP